MVHLYVCMYVCTYVRMYVLCMSLWICVCMYVCMYVCVCVCVCVQTSESLYLSINFAYLRRLNVCKWRILYILNLRLKYKKRRTFTGWQSKINLFRHHKEAVRCNRVWTWNMSLLVQHQKSFRLWQCIQLWPARSLGATEEYFYLNKKTGNGRGWGNALTLKTS